ncbi:HNH endonuclease signature motif containing protein [Knoellia locipacati]|nr:HNH endonuclease signature motif containing protein [Knoellia locipacati]
MDPRTATDARQGRYAVLLESARTLTTEQLLDVIEEAQRDKDAACARQAVALAHLSAIEPTRQEDGTEVEVHHGLGHQRLDAPELAAPRMGVSVHVAANRVTDAIHQMTRTPAVVDAMTAGELDERRAAVVTEETDILDAEDAATVVDAVRPHWERLTTGPLRRFVARTVGRLFPDALADEAERARDRRVLTRVTGEHGVDQWRADLLVEQSRLAWTAVTELARQLVRDGKADNLTQARADAMAQLILEHSDVSVVLHATRADVTTGSVPEPASVPESGSTPSDAQAVPGAGPDDGWCEIGGLGAPGTTFVPARWLAAATSTAAPGLTCHPVTGALTGGDVPAGLATGRDLTGTSTTTSETYRIPAVMARFVRLRDGGCRFPGCSTPARQCDLDHVRPWPAGPTSPANLIALCRRHHRIKQRDGWTPRLHPDGTVDWTDPTGARSTTSAVDHLHLGATAPASGAGSGDASSAAARTHHLDLSPLDDQLAELLTLHARTRPHRHRADDGLRPPPRVDRHWTDLAFDPPPREPHPDVIPF